MLHITNGDAAAGALRQAGFTEEILAWRDVLHEGPVREGLSLQELSCERAAFIAQARWGSFDEALAAFRGRDAALLACDTHEEVVLWFEHDLYDQLQLIQLLDWFSVHAHPRLTLVCETEYLGPMAPGRMRELFRARKPAHDVELHEGARAWAALRASDPSSLSAGSFDELRFLGPAIRRLLQEYPWVCDGLSLTERHVLEALSRGPLEFPELFAAIEEEPKFLGDAVLVWHLRRMQADGLLERRGERWAATGRARLRRLPRWLGGVRIDEACRWRWDAALGTVVQVLEMGQI